MQTPDENEPIPALRRRMPWRAKDLLRHPNRVLCFCHGVSAAPVVEILREHPANPIGEVGARCKAGTGCTSCRPLIEEMARMIREGRG